MDQSSKPVIQGLILKSKANIANVLTEHHEGCSRKSNYNLAKIYAFVHEIYTVSIDAYSRCRCYDFNKLFNQALILHNIGIKAFYI